MVVNRAAAADVTDVFQKLFEAQYPIERMTLIDDFGADDEASMRANNSSAFNFRVVKGSKKLSAHARGLAVDINPLYNPYVRVMKDGTTVVQPEAGRPYADREGIYRGEALQGEGLELGRRLEVAQRLSALREAAAVTDLSIRNGQLRPGARMSRPTKSTYPAA